MSDFLKKLSNLELGLYWRPIGSPTWVFQRTQYCTSKNSRWQTAAILKIVLGHNSASCPISVKFVWGSSFSQNFSNGTDTRIPQKVFFFVSLMQFGLRQMAAFVSLPIHHTLFDEISRKSIQKSAVLYTTSAILQPSPASHNGYVLTEVSPRNLTDLDQTSNSLTRRNHIHVSCSDDKIRGVD